jgi:hypothetical protein
MTKWPTKTISRDYLFDDLKIIYKLLLFLGLSKAEGIHRLSERELGLHIQSESRSTTLDVKDLAILWNVLKKGLVVLFTYVQVNGIPEVSHPTPKLRSTSLPVCAVESKNAMWSDWPKHGFSQGRTIKICKCCGQHMLDVFCTAGENQSVAENVGFICVAISLKQRICIPE